MRPRARIDANWQSSLSLFGATANVKPNQVDGSFTRERNTSPVNFTYFPDDEYP